MAQTLTARQMAAQVSKAVGRQVTAKQVRAAARDQIAAYDDDGYTAHAYDARQASTLLAYFRARAAKGRTSVPVRVRAAGRAAKATPVKSTTPPPKVGGPGSAVDRAVKAAVAPAAPKV